MWSDSVITGYAFHISISNKTNHRRRRRRRHPPTRLKFTKHFESSLKSFIVGVYSCTTTSSNSNSNTNRYHKSLKLLSALGFFISFHFTAKCFENIRSHHIRLLDQVHLYTITIQTTLIFHQSYTIIEYMLHASKFRYRQTQASTKRSRQSEWVCEWERKHCIAMICFALLYFTLLYFALPCMAVLYATHTQTTRLNAPNKRKSFTFIQFWWVRTCCVACWLNELHFILSFRPVSDGIPIVFGFLLFHHLSTDQIAWLKAKAY